MWAESPARAPTNWDKAKGGPGSIFTFTIQAQAAPSPPRPYLLAVQPDLCHKRVLIVDDNATNRQILVRQTLAWGMLARTTASPSEALGWIRDGAPFDVAILDLQMPEMDGLTLAAEIHHERSKGLPGPAPLPTIILSSGQREADPKGPPIAAFLTKPVKASQLYNVLVGLFAEEARPADRRKAAQRPQFDAQMGQQLPLRILLAEDNAVNQQVALSFLARLGYRADVAANGLEVLQSLQRQPYDVVLMDVHMPEMDGLEATRQIRRLPQSAFAARAQPQIVAMTADAMKEDREACLAAGMDDYISKPIQVVELIAALSRCQTGPGQPQPARVPAQSLKVPAPEPIVAGAAPKVLDPGALTQLRTTLGSQADEMLPELLEQFYRDAERLLDQARQALAQEQEDELRRAAHSLKSIAATFGALALSAVARELETRARDGVLEGAAGRIVQAETELARAKTALEATQRAADRAGEG
jgi:CheY-like chemotaxis protein